MTRTTDGAKRTASLEKLVSGLPSARAVMNLTVVYEEAQTHKWAGEVYQTMENLLGAEGVRGTWWKLGDFDQPGVLAGAVSKAMRSDMIIVSVRGSEGLPLPFYYWVNSWLPHRVGRAGGLVAFLCAPVPRTTQSGRLRRFLRTVARRGRMDFLVAERVVEAHPSKLPLRIELGI